MKRLATLLIILVSGLQITQAQTLNDALRFSQIDLIGSARNLGVANSMNAIGADFSTIAINPAGLGAFRSSEFVFTPMIYSNKTNSTLESTSGRHTDSKGNLAISNVGFVVANKPRSPHWKTSNFAIGFNRIGDFNQQFQFGGTTRGSITDRFMELADGVTPENLNGLEEGLAYSAGAIFDFENDLTYTSDYADYRDTELTKRQFVESDGHNTEITLAYGANLDEKLLIGFSANLPIVSFTEAKSYEEDDLSEDNIPIFNELQYDEYLNTSGYGFNLKFGATYKVTKKTSLGVAFHTPTRFRLTDNYSTRLRYSYNDGTQNNLDERSPDGSFDYALVTPWKAIGSLGIIIAKSGFVSGEVEWTDFSNASFDYTGFRNGNQFRDAENEVNQSIDQQLGSALKVRLGGEYAYQKLRLRAGVGLTQSPYANDNDFNKSYHAGIGIREDKFFIDLGFQIFDIAEGYLPYQVDNQPVQLVQNDVTLSRLVSTFGFKF